MAVPEKRVARRVGGTRAPAAREPAVVQAEGRAPWGPGARGVAALAIRPAARRALAARATARICKMIQRTAGRAASRAAPGRIAAPATALRHRAKRPVATPRNAAVRPVAVPARSVVTHRALST